MPAFSSSAVLLAALFAAGEGGSVDPGRYRHARHAELVLGKKLPEIPCNACHRLSAKEQWEQRLPVGKAGGVHGACSRAGCHAQQFVRFRDARAFCMSCHQGKLGRTLLFPPYRGRADGDFVLPAFGHAEHNREDKKTCPQCHTLSTQTVGRKEMREVSHDRCGSAICHGDSVPPLMAACGGCHVAKDREVRHALASAAQDPHRVDAKFDHRLHRLRSPKEGCGDCHVNVAVGRGERVPLPPMIACERCHDGKGAFAALGATCLRCHGTKEPS